MSSSSFAGASWFPAAAVATGALLLGTAALWSTAPTEAYTIAGTRTAQPVLARPVALWSGTPGRVVSTVAAASSDIASPSASEAPQTVRGPLGWLLGAAAFAAAAVWVAAHPQRPPIAMMTTTGAGKDTEVDLDALLAQMLTLDDGNLKLMVAQSMPALKSPFFLKLEERIKAAPTEEEKARLNAFGDRILFHMKGIVDQATAKVQEQGVRITGLIGIFSEEDGTIKMPLTPEKIARLREVMRQDLSAMSNDVFINAVLAFMAKAGEEKKMELIEILQRVLQAYAAESLLIMCPHGGPGALPENIMVWNMLLNSEFEQWDDILKREFFAPGGKDVDAFLTMLDTGVGAVVYEQSKGGIQQLLAQYVFQIISRINKLKEAKA